MVVDIEQHPGEPCRRQHGQVELLDAPFEVSGALTGCQVGQPGDGPYRKIEQFRQAANDFQKIPISPQTILPDQAARRPGR